MRIFRCRESSDRWRRRYHEPYGSGRKGETGRETANGLTLRTALRRYRRGNMARTVDFNVLKRLANRIWEMLMKNCSPFSLFISSSSGGDCRRIRPRRFIYLRKLTATILMYRIYFNQISISGVFRNGRSKSNIYSSRGLLLSIRY